MGLEIRSHAAEGTGWNYLLDALAKTVDRHKLDKDLRKVRLNAIQGRPRSGYFNVLNVDGVYYDKPRLHWNDPIRRAIESHDLVIYQSHYSKRMAEKMLEVKAHRDAVVHGGTSMKPFRIPLPRQPLIVACAHWRPNKRPVAIAEGFRFALERKWIPGQARLVMVGPASSDQRLEHPAVHYTGNLGRAALRRLLGTARLMVHICHIDSCPNAVIEALAMQVPVVCNNIGGTPELVGETGTIAKLDRVFRFRPIAAIEDVGDRSVDIPTLAEAIGSAYESARHVPRPDLSILHCATRYLDAITAAMR